MAYETLFVRLDILIRGNKNLAGFAKKQIFYVCGLSLAKLNRFVEENNSRFLRITDNKDVEQMLRDFRTRRN